MPSRRELETLLRGINDEAIRPGSVAFLSESAAIRASILDWSRESGVGFSALVDTHALPGVDFADLIDYFADHAPTRSLVLYMESIGDARKFLSAARSASRSKPIIVVKAGRHRAKAGSDAALDAAFRRAGVLRVGGIAELFHMAEILATQPRPLGPALAIVTNAGGPGLMAVDEVLSRGGHLANLRPETLAALGRDHGNPVDLSGDDSPHRYRLAVEACLSDGNAQGVLVLLCPRLGTDPAEAARQLVPLAQSRRKPLLACWLGGPAVREGRELLAQSGIPTFDAPEGAIRAFLHMVQHRRNQELPYETPESQPDAWQPHVSRVRQMIDRARAESRGLLTESEAKEILAAYGIPVVLSVPCRTMEAAVTAAKQVGFPVVLKLLSTTITHKADVGGVRLALADEAAVCAAYDAIRAGVSKKFGPEAFEGVTVQAMILDRGIELTLGSKVDRQLGPVIAFGAGGALADVTDDGSLGLPPLNRTLARRLMEPTRVYQALQGGRGRAGVDLAALETLLARFSQLVCDFPELGEVELNPVLATPQRLLTLDARVLLVPPGERPRLAIRPYPNQYTAPFTLRDGTRVTVRAIRPEDEPLLVALHGRHSEHTIRMRFFSLVKTLSRDSLIRLCHLDYDREMALAAVLSETAGPRLLGVSRYYLDPESGRAEFALVVEDAFQGRGVGRHLLTRLIGVARERGVRVLYGQVLRDNATMLALLASLGFGPPATVESDVVEVEMELTLSAG